MRDTRIITSGQRERILGLVGAGRARRWKVQWDGGAVEAVHARSLRVEGDRAPGAHGPAGGAEAGTAAEHTQLSESEEEASSASETEEEASEDDDESECEESDAQESEGEDQDAPAAGDPGAAAAATLPAAPAAPPADPTLKATVHGQSWYERGDVVGVLNPSLSPQPPQAQLLGIMLSVLQHTRIDFFQHLIRPDLVASKPRSRLLWSLPLALRPPT